MFINHSVLYPLWIATSLWVNSVMCISTDLIFAIAFFPHGKTYIWISLFYKVISIGRYSWKSVLSISRSDVQTFSFWNFTCQLSCIVEIKRSLFCITSIWVSQTTCLAERAILIQSKDYTYQKKPDSPLYSTR